MTEAGRTRAKATSFDHARGLVERVCTLAGSPTLIEDTRVHLARAGVTEAVCDHDDGVLFGWLMEVLSYQGIADGLVMFGGLAEGGHPS